MAADVVGGMPPSLVSLTEKVSSHAASCRARGSSLLTHRTAYSDLRNKLETLSDTTSHQVMVPLTSKAFMRGHLVHTNEILVLLGENWFMETSAKKATELVDRRLKECDSLLEKVEEELKRTEGWVGKVNEVEREREECVDIREEEGEQEAMEWRNKHRESVKREKLKGVKEQMSHEDVMRRLEELEVREALEEQWGEEDSESESEEELITDEEEVEEESGGEDMKDSSESVARSKPARRVSWAPEDETMMATEEESNPEVVLSFKHSGQSPAEQRSFVSTPEKPSDLVHYICPSLRPILKPSSAPILVREEDPPEQKEVPDVFEDPCNQTVVEKQMGNGKEEVEEEPPKRVSKFKAMRAAKLH